MKKSIVLISSLLLGILFAGCVNPPAPQPLPQPLPPVPAPVRTETQAKANISVVNEAKTLLRVGFTWDRSETEFCNALALRLAGAVTGQATVVTSNPVDLKINITPDFEIKDKSGEYIRINCNQLSIQISDARQIYALKTVTPSARPRQLSAKQAKQQYIAPIAAELIPFIQNSINKITNDEIAVSILDFNLKNYQTTPESQYVAMQVEKINRALASTDGVINYANIRQDVSSATCSFRVVYLKNKLPQGIANVINLKLAAK